MSSQKQRPDDHRAHRKSSIKERARAFGGTTSDEDLINSMLSPAPSEKAKVSLSSGSGGTGRINSLTNKIREFELGHDSQGSAGRDDNYHQNNDNNNNSSSIFDQSFDHMRYENDRQQILMQRSGTVKKITVQFNEQIAANEAAWEKAMAEKAAKKKRYRSKKKQKQKQKKRGKTKPLDESKRHLASSSESVWSNQMAAPSFKIDPRTYQVPNNLRTPTDDQKKIIRQVMKDNILIRDGPVAQQDALLHAFEPLEVTKGQTIEDTDADDYFYVVQEGKVDIEKKGKVLGTARSGETFGDMNLVYRKDIGRKKSADFDIMENPQILVAKEDAKLLRLKQDDFRGIIQYQAKQEVIDKHEMLRKLPFLKKLLLARDTNKKNEHAASDVIDRIASVMQPLYFSKGDELYDKDDETLYMIQEGNVKLTSAKDQQFVLGPGDYIGRQALMGSRGKEPEVRSLEALSSGVAYFIAKSVAEKVLGQNYVNRQTLRLDDSKKLDNFQCIKSVNLDPKTLTTLAETVADQRFEAGSFVMRQGEQVEPCLYLIREGMIALSSNDGSFEREVGPGGYFGVEKLLIPKNVSGEKAKPSKEMKLPAQWNVRVSKQGPCILGVLSLVDSQEILDNDGEKKEQPLVVKPESKMVVKRKQTSKIVRSKVGLDDLEMVNILGEGAFGEVWLVQAEVEGKKEEFALKKISKENEMIDALNREVKFLTSFGFHPFIVDLIKVFDRDDSMYMLMNLASGGELWDVVHREDADGNWTSGIPEEQARFYTFLLADTLAYIHSKKFVYRDLKPENILIDTDGYPILIDFGFSKHCPEKTYTCCGTPNYVAPEIITNEGHDQAVDWWALGVVYYEMISGEHPFYVDGMDQISVFESIAIEDYIPIPIQTAPEVIELIDGFLVKEPAQRLGNLAGRENDIIGHPYFDGLDLPTLRSRKQKAPWVPSSR